MSLLVIDCDDLKEINDRAGHEFGDALLREVAGVLHGPCPRARRQVGSAATSSSSRSPRRARTWPRRSASASAVPRRGADRGGVPPPDQRRHLHISVRRRGPDRAPPGGRPGALRREGRRKDRIASFSDIARPDLRAQKPGRTPESGGVARRATRLSSATRPPRSRPSTPRLRVAESATGCASRWCSSWARRRAQPRRSTASTSSTLPHMPYATLRSGARPRWWIADFPLTAEVLRTAEPRAVSFADGDVDPAEAFILRELNMSALLMLPLRVRGTAWGLVELYEMRLRTLLRGGPGRRAIPRRPGGTPARPDRDRGSAAPAAARLRAPSDRERRGPRTR